MVTHVFPIVFGTKATIAGGALGCAGTAIYQWFKGLCTSSEGGEDDELDMPQIQRATGVGMLVGGLSLPLFTHLPHPIICPASLTAQAALLGGSRALLFFSPYIAVSVFFPEVITNRIPGYIVLNSIIGVGAGSLGYAAIQGSWMGISREAHNSLMHLISSMTLGQAAIAIFQLTQGLTEWRMKQTLAPSKHPFVPQLYWFSTRGSQIVGTYLAAGLITGCFHPHETVFDFMILAPGILFAQLNNLHQGLPTEGFNDTQLTRSLRAALPFGAVPAGLKLMDGQKYFESALDILAFVCSAGFMFTFSSQWEQYLESAHSGQKKLAAKVIDKGSE